MSHVNNYMPPVAVKVFTTAGSDIDVRITRTHGEVLVPQFAIIGAGTATAASLVLEYENNGEGDETIPVNEGFYIGGGFTKIDATSDSGIIVVCWY